MDNRWNFERSSGYAGYRCGSCGKWCYANQPLECECTNPKKFDNNFNINPADKFYPNNDTCDYAIFLGKFVDSAGKKYDLYIFDVGGDIRQDEETYRQYYRPDWCDATIHSNKIGDYTSGPINPESMKGEDREWKNEVYRRAKILNIVKF